MFPVPQNEQEVLNAVVALLPTALRSQGRRTVDSGSAHRVVLIGESAVIRIARDQGAGTAMARRQKLVDQLPALRFQLPRSLSDVVTIEGTSAVAVEFIGGEAAPPSSVSPNELRMLLAEVQRIPIDPIRSLLDRPMAFCGGAGWVAIQRESVLPRLPRSVRSQARDAVDALAALEPETSTFSHGDLGGHNVRWQDGRILGVVDWDLASASDRSTDIATLAAWHGFAGLETVADPQDLVRARTRHATFILQQLAFQLLHERTEAEIQRSIDRAVARFSAPSI